MRTSASGRTLIEAFEGLFLHSYRDSVGVWTIGYGHTTAAGGSPVGPGMTITHEQADEILADDLARVEKNVEACISVPLTQYEFDALVSFDFNTGSLRKGSIDDKINAGQKQAAMNTLLLYNHAGGNVLAGLTRRRHAEKLMFEGKVDDSLKLAKG
jgi:lysozyme